MIENETVLLNDYSNMFEKCILVKVETDHFNQRRLDTGDVADITSFARYLRRSLSLPKLADKVMSMRKDDLNGYITWGQALTLVEPYIKMSKSAETSFVNDENHPNQRDFRIKIQGKSLSNTPVASSKGHTDIVSERRPSFHFEDTISCIRSQDLDRNSLVAALHNHHLNVTSALHYDDIGSQVLQKSISKSIDKSDGDMNKFEDIDLEDTTYHTLSKIDTSANNSSSVIVSTSESPSIEQSVSPNVKPFKSMSSSRSSSPITVRRKSSFLETVTSVILGTFSRGTSPRASPNGTPRQSAKSPVINTNDHLKTSTSVTTDDGWKVMSSPEDSNNHSSDSSEEFKDTAVFPTPDNDFQGSDLPGKPPKHGRNSKTSLSINTNISVSRRQSIDSALGSNDGSELDSPSSGRASVSSLYNYKARRRSTLEALGWVNRPNSPSTTNNDVLRRLNGTGSVSSSVAGDSPKARQQRSGEGLAARLRAEVLQPMSHSPNSTQRIIAALSLDSDLGHISLDNSPRNSTLSLSYTGTPRESALSAEEEAATNRLKNGIHRMQSRVTDTTLTQFNPYGLLTDDDVIISGDNTAKPGTWEFFSTRERPLCMAHQAVEERRKELLMSLPTLLVRNRTISFPHSSEVQLDSPIWEHYNMIAQPRDQVGSASVDTADDNDDDGVSLASLGSTYLPRGGLQRPSHVGTDNLSEHDLHSGIAFYGSAARRTRHGFYALRFLVLYGERNEMNGLPCLCVYTKSASSAWGESPVGFKSCILASDILDVAIEEPKNTARHLWQVTATRFFTHKQDDVDQYSDGKVVKIVFDSPSAVDRLSWISWLQIAKSHAEEVVARQTRINTTHV